MRTASRGIQRLKRQPDLTKQEKRKNTKEKEIKKKKDREDSGPGTICPY